MIELKRLGNVYGEQFGTGYAGNVWDSDGLAPTLKNEGGGGGRVPMIVETTEALGGIYTQDSVAFNRGMLPNVSRCLKANTHDASVVEKVPVKEEEDVIVDDLYPDRVRTYEEYSPGIRSEREGLKVVEEPISTNGTDISGCLRATYYKNGERNIIKNLEEGQGYEGVIEPQVLSAKRTEYGKAIRKDYEAHEIRESRHNMTELEPRKDGVCNTVTTVQKDCLVLEPLPYAMRGRNPDNPSDRTSGVHTEQRLELNPGGVSNCITSVVKDSMVLEPEEINYHIPDMNNFNQRAVVHDPEGISRTIIGQGHAGTEPKVIEKVGVRQATSKGFIECEVGGVADLSYPESKLRRGRVQGGGQICPALTSSGGGIVRIEKADGMEELQGVNTENNGVARPIKAQYYKTSGANFLRTGDQGSTGVAKIEDDNPHVQTRYRIRKLTPRECFRLMDFSDEDFDRAKEVNSNTQLYKQAGNSIVCNVLVALFGQMFEGKEDIYKHIDDDFIDDSMTDTAQLPQEQEESVDIKKQIFKDVLDKFETEELKLYCEDMIELIDERQLRTPSSTSLKYHNATQCQPGGQAYHVLLTATIMNYLLDLEYIQKKFPKPKQRDCLRVGILLHDAVKLGNGNSKYTVHEHPLLAAKWIEETSPEHDIKAELKKYISSLVARHSGSWTTSPRSSVVLPAPETDDQFFVHLCDLLGSRSNIDMTYTDEQIEAINKLVES